MVELAAMAMAMAMQSAQRQRNAATQKIDKWKQLVVNCYEDCKGVRRFDFEKLGAEKRGSTNKMR